MLPGRGVRLSEHDESPHSGAALWAVLTLALPVEAQRGVPAASRWPPPPLDMQVPFEPTAFPSAGRIHVTYELHIRNFAPNSVTLQRVEILDADTTGAPPIAVFEAEALESILQPVGVQPRAGTAGERRQLAGGGSVVLFLSVAFDRGARVPSALWHRVATGDYTTEGAAISTQHSELRVLGPPLRGTDWLAGSGPSNGYAIDWTQVEQGSTFSGDALDNRSYHAYGEEVLAVASGRLVWARDGIPENVPRHEGFRPAVADESWQVRRHELPLKDMLVDFGSSGADGK